MWPPPAVASCETSKTSCTFSGLPTGVSYTFTVTASNTHPGRAGTGTGPGRTSSKVLVIGLPSAPQALKVTPGDRRLTVSFRPTATNGGGNVTGYQLSTDGAKTWKKATSSGTSALKVTVAPVLNGAKFSVTVRAVNAVGAGKAAGPVKATTVQWFKDPVSKAAKAKQVSVPKKPASYRAPVRSTRATMRSADGKVAMSGASLKGRQLQAGQAANLDTLFAWDNAILTLRGKAQVKAFAGSLRYVKAVTCEGHADFGGLASHEKMLSVRRADVVCDLVKRYAPQVTSRKEKAYGAARPVVVGGRTTDRSANRRVVVLVRG